jgi:hypothetical protein
VAEVARLARAMDGVFGAAGAAVDESGEWYPIDKTFVTGFE